MTKIEWSDKTWNPLFGCTKVAKACRMCYAEVMARRQRGAALKKIDKGEDPGKSGYYMDVISKRKWNGKIKLGPEFLLEPFGWSKSSLVFVNSMSDLFHKEVPDKFIEAAFTSMTMANWHIYQVLTKRPERMREFFDDWGFVPDHIWLGTSIGERKKLRNLRELQGISCQTGPRFISFEPLLEDLGHLDLHGIDQAIVGGESGRKAVPVNESWVRKIQDACLESGTAFFFKQWGGPNKKETGRLLDGKTYDEFPPILLEPVPGKKERERRKQKCASKIVTYGYNVGMEV